MLRKALIIGSPDKEIPGVYADMENYRSFLKSFAGGAWYEHEIVTLESPTKTQLDAQLQTLQTVDYSFLVFAGHGGYSQSRRTTLLQINPNTHLDENELKIGAPKRTVIFDTCRVLLRETLDFREAVMKGVLAMDSYRDPEITRRFFEKSLDACYPGIAIMYGCNIGESAGDINGVGGRYSSTLIRVVTDWEKVQGQRGTVLSVSDAHEQAASIVRRQSGNSQNPMSEFPRTVPRFPLGVRA
jgi:hypothetical protein